MSVNISENLALVGRVNPATVAIGTADTDVIDLSRFNRVFFSLLTGTLPAGATVDFKLQQSDLPGGTFTDITGKAITQLTQVGGHSNSQVIVEMRNEDLLDDRRYIRGRVTVGVAASPLAVIALAGEPRFAPIFDVDLASVLQILA